MERKTRGLFGPKPIYSSILETRAGLVGINHYLTAHTKVMPATLPGQDSNILPASECQGRGWITLGWIKTLTNMQENWVLENIL